MSDDYVELSRQIREAGLLDRQYGYYVLKIAVNLTLVAISIFFLITVQNFWLHMLNAVFLAFAIAQNGYLSHDSGHMEVFKSRKKNDVTSLLFGSLIIHMCSITWSDKHAIHHKNTNIVGEDPDIDIPLLAYTEEEALSNTGIKRNIMKYQAFYWILLMMAIGVFTRASLVMTALDQLKTKQQKRILTDIGFFIAGAIMYYTLIFYFLPLPTAVAFIVVNYIASGLFLGTVFATNHKGMPILKKRPDFLKLQVGTARNVKSNPITDFWMGGLNYQIEHHLFPTMPRNNFAKARKIIKPFCEKRGIVYCETGFWESYREVLSNFHRISAVLRKPKAQM